MYVWILAPPHWPTTRPVAYAVTLKLQSIYAAALYRDPDATLDEVREAVTTLEDADQIARRVLGGAHPLTSQTEQHLRKSRAALAARETPPPT